MPSESAVPTEAPSETGIAPSVSPSPSPITGPTANEGGPPILAIGGLVLLIGLLAVAAVYFVRSQRSGDDEAYESVWPAAETSHPEDPDDLDDEDEPRA